MNADTRRHLHALNLAFYAEHADEFDATRERAWPGWKRVLVHGPRASDSEGEPPLRLLDIGCGNGRLARFFAEALTRPLDYVGVDASEALLANARRRSQNPCTGRIRFERQDFLTDAPGQALPAGPFDIVALFGVLHHVAGLGTRIQLLEQAAARVAAGGLLVFTFWRFAESPRLRGRIAPWGQEVQAGIEVIDPQQLEPGDHLLRWGAEAGRLRYCHHADAAEVDRLVEAVVEATGLECLDRFDADGSAQPLNEYLVLRRRLEP